MKIFISTLILIVLNITGTVVPQTAEQEPYKIVFQLVSGDSTVHKAFMKQLSNILAEDPRTDIKVVCHGAGMGLLMKSKSTQQAKIKAFTEKGIEFVACENSMIGRNIPKEDIVSQASFAKAGILHIVKLQNEGYAYIKAGS